MSSVTAVDFTAVNKLSLPELTRKLNQDRDFRLRIFSQLEKLPNTQINSQATLINRMIQILPSGLTQENLDRFLCIFDKIRSANGLFDPFHPYLMQSVRHGKLDLVIGLVERGAKINNQAVIELTPLYEAMVYKQEEIALYLISKGALLSLKDQFGNSYLHIACSYHLKSVVKSLVAKGLDVNQENRNRQTPVRIVLVQKNRALFLEMVDLGATLKESDLPLVQTMRELEYGTVTLATDSSILGDNLNELEELVQQDQGYSIKQIVTLYYYKKGNLEGMRDLSNGTVPIAKLCAEEKLFQSMRQTRSTLLLGKLIKMDIRFADRILDDETLFIDVMKEMLKAGDPYLYIVMAKKGAQRFPHFLKVLNSQTEDSSRALQSLEQVVEGEWAYPQRMIEIIFEEGIATNNYPLLLEILKVTEQVDFLLLKQPLPSIIKLFEEAFQCSQFSITNRIVEKGVTEGINLVAEIYCSSPKVGKELLSHIGDYPDQFLVDLFFLTTHNKDNFCCFAVIGKIKEINTLGTTSLRRTVLHRAVDVGNILYVVVILARSPDVDIRELQTGNTPLHIACARGQLEISTLLLQHKANPNKLNRKYVSPLYLAAINKHSLLIKSFIEKRLIDINSIVNKKGDTLLHCSIKHFDYALILYLLNNHAKVNQENLRGKTPLCALMETHLIDFEFNRTFALFLKHRANTNIEIDSVPLFEYLIRQKKIPGIISLIKEGVSLFAPRRVPVTYMEFLFRTVKTSEFERIVEAIPDPLEKRIGKLIVALRNYKYREISRLIEEGVTGENGLIFVKRAMSISHLGKGVASRTMDQLIDLFPRESYFDELSLNKRLEFLPMLAPSDVIKTLMELDVSDGNAKLDVLYKELIPVPDNERGIQMFIRRAIEVFSNKLERIDTAVIALESFEETVINEAKRFIKSIDYQTLAFAASQDAIRKPLLFFMPILTTVQYRVVVPFLLSEELAKSVQKLGVDRKMEIIESATKTQIVRVFPSGFDFTSEFEQMDAHLSRFLEGVTQLEQDKESSTFNEQRNLFLGELGALKLTIWLHDQEKIFKRISVVCVRHEIYGKEKDLEQRTSFQKMFNSIKLKYEELTNRISQLKKDEGDEFICPMMGIIMQDPVGDPTTDGKVVYDRSFFTDPGFNGLSPSTGQPIDVSTLTTNVELKKRIDAYLSKKK